MSYILDALQKSSAETTTDALENQPRQRESAGLPLLWKLAIGAVLATNLVLLYLWQTDRGQTDRGQTDRGQTDPGQADGARAASAPRVAQRQQAPTTSQTTTNRSPTASAKKKTLPGIASPRELPPARPPAANSPAGAPRTFKPRGAPITIADADAPPAQASTPEPSLLEQFQASTAPAPVPATAPREQQPRAPAQQPRGISQLSDLSESARQALYVLTFSFHIYAEDADLRAVVVNGERLAEGSLIKTESGQSFRLLEILDNGVILQFDHNGSLQTVQIPVIEDWKDA